MDLPTGASEAPLASINVQNFGHFTQDLLLLGQAGGQLDDLEFGFGGGGAGGGMGGRTSLDVLPVADQWVAAASHTIARCVHERKGFNLDLFVVVWRAYLARLSADPSLSLPRTLNTTCCRRERITMEEAEQAMVGLDQSFDPNAELEDWGPFQPGLNEETRSPSGMYDEEDMDGEFFLGRSVCVGFTRIATDRHSLPSLSSSPHRERRALFGHRGGP